MGSESDRDGKGRMKVEIWSDVMCPFCYIGKRRFEAALDRFPRKGDIEVTWRSFQLDPGLEARPGRSVNEYLAERKGWTVDQARKLNDQVTRSAQGVGLAYDFDKAVVANSFDAHRLVQFAKTRGRGDAAEEGLFRAYFTEGKDIADRETLASIGTDAGLDGSEVRAALDSGAFAAEVHGDIQEARRIGVQGVPFFVMDRKYAVSGAQDSETFLKALEQSFDERGATP